MSASPNVPGSPSPQRPARSPLQARLERLVGQARAALWWEGLWPALWAPLRVLMTFAALSWLGLWLDLTPFARKVGVGLFAAALLLSLWPLVRLRPPARATALARLDRDSGLKHGPARAFEDTLALGHEDPGSRTLWDLHRRRAEAAIERLRVAAPRPDMPRRDRYAVRAAALVTVVASAF